MAADSCLDLAPNLSSATALLITHSPEWNVDGLVATEESSMKVIEVLLSLARLRLRTPASADGVCRSKERGQDIASEVGSLLV
jgi:hypothetical protein